MQNIPDKDIDQIIKQAADNHKVPFNSAAWQKMEQKLEKADKNAVLLKKLRNGILFLALLSLIGFILLNENAGPLIFKKHNAEQNHYQQETQKSAGQESEKGSLDNEQIYNDNNNKSLAEGNDPLPLFDKDDHDDSSSDDINNTAVKFSTNKKDHSTLAKTAILNKVKVFNPVTSPLTYSNPVNITTTENNKLIKNPDADFKPYFTAALTIAPDLSGVGLSSFSQPGTNVGIIMEYSVSKRFSLSSGIIYSNKIYSVLEGFNPYEGYWYQKPKPDRVDGTCDVIDIPVNVRYNIVSHSKNKIFVSAGISTYLMLTEDYNFIYKDHPNYPYSKRNENQHLFGIGNFSLGYEKFLHPRWSLQIEPFIKLPLTEIGVGNLDLLSTGAFLSIKHHFIR